MMIPIISAVILFIGPAIPLADQQSATENSDSAMDVKKETLEAVEALKQYSIEKKDLAVKEVKAKPSTSTWTGSPSKAKAFVSRLMPAFCRFACRRTRLS